MPYTDRDFKTKKAMREFYEAGHPVYVYQPGPFGPEVKDGRACIEGPHGFHRWYAAVTVRDGQVVQMDGSKMKF